MKEGTYAAHPLGPHHKSLKSYYTRRFIVFTLLVYGIC